MPRAAAFFANVLNAQAVAKQVFNAGWPAT
jgi:hypothetical protein